MCRGIEKSSESMAQEETKDTKKKRWQAGAKSSPGAYIHIQTGIYIRKNKAAKRKLNQEKYIYIWYICVCRRGKEEEGNV